VLQAFLHELLDAELYRLRGKKYLKTALLIIDELGF
jgi:hypothetical protein